MKYSVLFGYTGKLPQEEWLKFETDDLDSAVNFCKKYPDMLDVEADGFVYVADEEGQVVGDHWYEILAKR